MKTSTETNETINKYYNDALFFGSSYLNTTSTYITPLEFKVMQKLIHYSKKQNNITWCSASIAQHLMEKEGAVQKAIQRLASKGYITTYNTVVPTSAGITKRRIIYIKWDFLKNLLNQFNTYQNNLKNNAQDEQIEEDETIPQPIEEKPLEVIKPIKQQEEMKQEPTNNKELIKILYSKKLKLEEENRFENMINEGQIIDEEMLEAYINAPSPIKEETKRSNK